MSATLEIQGIARGRGANAARQQKNGIVQGGVTMIRKTGYREDWGDDDIVDFRTNLKRISHRILYRELYGSSQAYSTSYMRGGVESESSIVGKMF